MTLYIRKKSIFVKDNLSARKTGKLFDDQIREASDFRFGIESLKFRLDMGNRGLHSAKIAQMC